MSRFYGILQGGRGEVTRTGHSGLHAIAASWSGAVRVDVTSDEQGRDAYSVELIRWHGHGESRHLCAGVFGEPAPAFSDKDATDAIHALLDGTEWGSETLEQIANLVRDTGRAIRDPFYAGPEVFEEEGARVADYRKAVQS